MAIIVPSSTHNTSSVPPCPSVRFTITPDWTDLYASSIAMWRTIVSGLVSKVIGTASVAGGVLVLVLAASAGVLTAYRRVRTGRFDVVLTGVAPSTICLTLYIVRCAECCICGY